MFITFPIRIVDTEDGRRQIEKLRAKGVTNDEMRLAYDDMGKEVIITNRAGLLKMMAQAPMGAMNALALVRRRFPGIDFTMDEELSLLNEAEKQIAQNKGEKVSDKYIGPHLKLATKKELVIELTSRKDTCALCIFQVKTPDGQIAYGYSHNFPTDDSFPEMMRDLARLFDASEPMGNAEDLL